MRIRTTAAEDGGGGGGGAPPTEYHSLASRAMEFDAGGSSQHCGLRRRGQSVAMAQAPSRKKADEVWGDIQQGGKKKKKMTMAMVMNNQLQSLDEMTLEDFLVKAGEAAECSDGNRIDQMGSFGFRPYMHWLHHQQQQQHHHPPLMAAGTGVILDSMYNDNQGNASSPSAVSPGSKRAAATDVISEKTTERRKKRMIKNRESAARSRARKQAYTNELENKISLLEAENERLRKQKELESEVHVPRPEPKYHLRRTRSAPF